MKKVYLFLFLFISWMSRGQNITQLEYFIDNDPGYGSATNVTIAAAPALNNFTFNIPLASVAPGFHTLYVRAKKANNKWSVVQGHRFVKVAVSAGTNVALVEYFMDADPGYGSGTPVTFTAGVSLTDLTFNIPLSAVGDGFHTLYVRVKDTNNKWSIVQSLRFVKVAVNAATTISRVEYFIDTDPGLGSGVAVPFSVGSSITNLTFDVPMTSLNDGFHTLFIRTKDSNNRWSIIRSHSFVKTLAKPNITYIEYYVDTDPGQGNAVSIPFTPAVSVADLTFSVDVASLSQGNHKLYVRAKNADNRWSSTSNENFIVCSLAPPVATPATDITSVGFKIHWDPVQGATGYDVDLSSNNFTTFSTGRITTGTVGIASGLKVNTTYQYRVRAIGSTCASANSNVVIVTTLNCDQPPKPTIALSNENTETPLLTSSASTENQWYKNGALIAGATNNKFTVTEPGLYKVQVKSEGCLSDFSDEVPIVITGSENLGSSMIMVFPNPVDEQLTFRGPDKIISCRLLDATGRDQDIPFESTSSNERHANVRHLSTGIYLLIVQDVQSLRYTRFLKK